MYLTQLTLNYLQPPRFRPDNGLTDHLEPTKRLAGSPFKGRLSDQESRNYQLGGLSHGQISAIHRLSQQSLLQHGLATPRLLQLLVSIGKSFRNKRVYSTDIE